MEYPSRADRDIAVDQLKTKLNNDAFLYDMLVNSQVSTTSLDALNKSAKAVILQISDRGAVNSDAIRFILHSSFSRITIGNESVSFEIDLGGLLRLLTDQNLQADPEIALGCLTIMQPIIVKRRGKEQRIVIDSSLVTKHPDHNLVSLIGKAHSLLAALTDGRAQSVGELADQMGIDNADISRLLPLAFLSPALTRDILTGQQQDITAGKLTRGIDLPAHWEAQVRAFS